MTAHRGDALVAVVEAWQHANLAQDDLIHLANWAGEDDCAAVVELAATIEALERAWTRATGKPAAELRRLVHGTGAVS